uniref:MMS19 nucleotide excision repair protein n=1 Tax=Brugia malayi TaxID=6279 RepID=A0A1I9G4X9_BRUMA|nr:BMA-MMS-19, isoform b [Brugia malayi]
MNEDKETIAEVDDDLCFVNQWVDKLSHGKSFTLRVFVESFQSEMKSNNREKRENGLKRICLVISKLPQNYPWELPHGRERTEITRELLVSGCESCLLADEEFAPFVFELIIEKLLDSEYSTDTKLEICSFLAKACAFFPCYQLIDHIGQLCAGIRSVLFNFPNDTRDDYMPESITAAVSSIIKAFDRSNIKDKRQHIESICHEFIEKGEMFVLQTELGLTGRLLAFFEILLRSSELCSTVIFESVFSWLLSLCKGDTASSSANKYEIVNSGLRFLCHWIDVADDSKQVALLRKYHSSFIEMLDKYDREIAQLARYKLLEVCIKLDVHTNGLLEKCKVFLRKSFDTICSENKELRNSCLMFVYAFASSKWTILKDLFVNEIGNNKEIFPLTPLLWSIIHDIDSLHFAVSYLGTLFPTTSACSNDLQEIFIEIFNKNRSGSITLHETLLSQTLNCFFVRLELHMGSEKDVEAESKLLQQIGLIISNGTHLDGLCLIREKLKYCPSLLPGLYLYIIQSPYNDELLKLLTQLDSVDGNLIWYKTLIMAALVNKSPNYIETLKHMEKIAQSFDFLDSFKCRTRLCVALLLTDRPEGSTYFTALLRDLVQYFDSENITVLKETLVDMLTFNTCYSDPIKCKYQTTFLWQQRLFCQLIPIYVQYFNDLSKESQNKRIVLYPLLAPLFALAASSTAIMNDKYVELLPILCAALDTSGLDLCAEGQIITGLAALLKNATAEQLGHDFLLKVLPRLQHYLEHNTNMMVQLATLECLKLIAQKWSSEALLPFYGPIVRSLIKISGSQKRIVRTAVANVRNLWELLPTK